MKRWFVKSSSIWPRYWLELLQSFQDQLKDKTPHLLNLARKGFLILKLAIIISLSTKIYYQDRKDIVTYFKILIQSQGEYKSWWFTMWIELRIDVGIFTHQWYAGGFLFAKPLKGVSSQKQVKKVVCKHSYELQVRLKREGSFVVFKLKMKGFVWDCEKCKRQSGPFVTNSFLWDPNI